MHDRTSRTRRLIVYVCALGAALALGAPAASARGAHPAPPVFKPCGGEDPAVQCATLPVPLDYDRPNGKRYGFYFARVPATDPAHKLGTLFFNFGGPGGDIASLFADFGAQIFPELSERYDIIAFDPRGTGGSEGAIDCHANQETEGLYSVPFVTPLNVDPPRLFAKTSAYVRKCLNANRRDVLAHASTANVARDIDYTRRALGLRKISYYGFSYGTFLGATYATLFPHRYDKMVLDGPIDPAQYINRPHQNLEEQTSGFERELGRFLMSCGRPSTG
jgi:pimeloyl-ACP methyl ester carboxylesterase